MTIHETWKYRLPVKYQADTGNTRHPHVRQQPTTPDFEGRYADFRTVFEQIVAEEMAEADCA